MADVASSFKDWSTTASSNAPSGSTTIGTGLDDNIRQVQATLRSSLGTKGSDIASATTTDLGAVEGLFHDITGTTTIVGFGTVSAGIWKIIKFEGILTLTNNAVSLILPGGANITTANGDEAFLHSEGSGNWRCALYSKASGLPPTEVSLVPAGVVSPYAGSAAPTGWLLCDGAAVSRTTYAVLFAVVSTTYGVGDGSTTFNVPDCKGRAVFGKESSETRITTAIAGINGGTLGAAGGDQRMHQHDHGVTDAGHVHGFTMTDTSGGATGAMRGLNNIGTNNTASATTGITIDNEGAGSSQNLPPAIILNMIIKT